MVNFAHDIFARRTCSVGSACPHFKIDFRCNYDFIAVKIELADEFPCDFFTASKLIDIRRIKEIYSKLNSSFEKRLCVFKFHCPRKNSILRTGFPEAHHSKTNSRNICAAVAKFYIFHKNFSVSKNLYFRMDLFYS